jgi:hypothetical protein
LEILIATIQNWRYLRGFPTPKSILEQNKRPHTLEGLRVFCATFSSLIWLFYLVKTCLDRKLKKIDTEAVSGDFNGHPRNQTVWVFDHFHNSHHNEHRMLENEAELSHK